MSKTTTIKTKMNVFHTDGSMCPTCADRVPAAHYHECEMINDVVGPRTTKPLGLWRLLYLAAWTFFRGRLP